MSKVGWVDETTSGIVERVVNDERSGAATGVELRVESRLSPAAIDRAAPGLPAVMTTNEVLLFSPFADADVRIGQRFASCARFPHSDEAVLASSTLIAVTQEFSKPFDGVPRGWKTIIHVRFDTEVPDLIRELPAAEGWYEYPASVRLTAESS